MGKTDVAQGPVDVNVRGRWEHCSPELLSAGIDCTKTPRRPCECEHGGSHDHFISDDRLEIETFDASATNITEAMRIPLANLRDRYARTGHLGVTGDELQLIRVFVDFYRDFWLRQPVSTYERACDELANVERK